MILYIWRHPKPMNTEGICIGQTDIGVDKRKLKRLANKIERFVRLHHSPKTIWVSPLQRSLKVGQILAQRSFECRVAPELAEIHFGEWMVRIGSKSPSKRLMSGVIILPILHPVMERAYSSYSSVLKVGWLRFQLNKKIAQY